MNARRMTRLASSILSLVLLAGAVVVAAPTSASACGVATLTRKDVFRAMRNGKMANAGAMETMSLKTLNLDYKADKKIYKVGSIAEVKVNVTRPAKEDPAGQGIPMDRPYVEPAEGITVGVGLSIGRVFLPGAAITDANGDALVRIKIESYAPANQWADVSVYAWRVIQETPCMTVQEYGYSTAPRMFRTSRPS